MTAKSILVIGGSGKVALKATALLTARGHQVSSCVRSEEQFDVIRQHNATPQLLSVEDASIDAFRTAMNGKDIVLWSAGNLTYSRKSAARVDIHTNADSRHALRRWW